MRSLLAACWALFILAVAGLAVWLLGLGPWIHQSLASGHLLDWVMGALCFLWLLVILKAPWDLYFQALQVSFEMQRSQERQIALPPGREAYLKTLRRRLGGLAVGAHLLSAALVAAVTYSSGGRAGYYFAAFYLVSTLFRPVLAGYVYLMRKLNAIGEEARYPREDIVEVRQKLKWQEATLRDLQDRMRDTREDLERERRTREGEEYEMRQNIQAISREFESTVSRLTDNQDVIKGIQAFVRLIGQASP
ncbi:MAG TPA: hypothetical protein VKU00_31310 [Chthonomonadaceae bacterium]|nr:hypothetical protein [Chthonomonadaceae bacterium]